MSTTAAVRSSGLGSVRRNTVRWSALLALIVLAAGPGCTAYKTLQVTSDPPGARVSRGGAELGVTPFSFQAASGDHMNCSPWYWSFELAAQLPGQAPATKYIEICSVPDGATIHFDLNVPQTAQGPSTAQQLHAIEQLAYHDQLLRALTSAWTSPGSMAGLSCTPLIAGQPAAGYRCSQPGSKPVTCEPVIAMQPDSGFRCR